MHDVATLTLLAVQDYLPFCFGARRPELTLFRHADLEMALLPAVAESAETAEECSRPSPFRGRGHVLTWRSQPTGYQRLIDVETSAGDGQLVRTAPNPPHTRAQELVRAAKPPRDAMNSDSTRSHRVEHLCRGLPTEYREESLADQSFSVLVITVPPGTYLWEHDMADVARASKAPTGKENDQVGQTGWWGML